MWIIILPAPEDIDIFCIFFDIYRLPFSAHSWYLDGAVRDNRVLDHIDGAP